MAIICNCRKCGTLVEIAEFIDTKAGVKDLVKATCHGETQPLSVTGHRNLDGSDVVLNFF
jgi:hypothetical protein